jgi:hypothetical protein
MKVKTAKDWLLHFEQRRRSEVLMSAIVTNPLARRPTASLLISAIRFRVFHHIAARALHMKRLHNYNANY